MLKSSGLDRSQSHAAEEEGASSSGPSPTSEAVEPALPGPLQHRRRPSRLLRPSLTSEAVEPGTCRPSPTSEVAEPALTALPNIGSVKSTKENPAGRAGTSSDTPRGGPQARINQVAKTPRRRKSGRRRERTAAVTVQREKTSTVAAATRSQSVAAVRNGPALSRPDASAGKADGRVSNRRVRKANSHADGRGEPSPLGPPPQRTWSDTLQSPFKKKKTQVGHVVLLGRPLHPRLPRPRPTPDGPCSLARRARGALRGDRSRAGRSLPPPTPAPAPGAKSDGAGQRGKVNGRPRLFSTQGSGPCRRPLRALEELPSQKTTTLKWLEIENGLSVLDTDVDTLAGNIKEILLTTAEETLGRYRKKNKPWVSGDILDLCDRRRELRQQKYTSQKTAAQYRQAHKAVRRRMREAKEKWIEDQCEEIQHGMASGNSRKAYETLKTLTKTQQPRTAVIEDSNAVRSMKPGKSPGIDNIPAELLRHGGEVVIDRYHELCRKIWEEKKWPKEWTQSLVIPLPKKGNLRQCQNYRTISLISHPSKILLRVILKRLKTKAKELLAEEQAGFRPGRSTTEQIFNSRLIIEKHLQHQRDLFHNFIEFKKAFDRVWHDALWWVLRGFGVEEGLIQTIEALYEKASSAVFLNNRVGEFFRTTVGVRQGCLISPVLFNLYLEKIMQDTLQDHHTSISIAGRRICNLRFADDIDLLAGTNTELQDLTDKLTQSTGSFGMEVSTEKSKVMVNSKDETQAVIYMNGQQLEEVGSFTYLGGSITKDGTSRTEVLKRITMATAAMARLDKIWNTRYISNSR
ncbi:Hypp3444 [Branchiostoma lanceolatum]|uniref:Hypp3444 protein n=1 Tax=Branchiostoma lanceolatum TaxID=7740 RepID=A0A8K0A2K6_BRALA|nr:Hypp3444 [Branchiostoma lanceolatum]